MNFIGALRARINSRVCNQQRATDDTHNNRLLRWLTTAAAYALVVASAGLCGLYAYGVGIERGVVMASLLVMMAVALECLKPAAVSAAFASFSQFALVRGTLLMLLALAAMAFSLVSELSLMAGSRGDLEAKRVAAAEQVEERKARLKAARSELATLMPAREVAEVVADIAKLKGENPKAGDCAIMDGPVSRAVCPQIAALEGEIGRAAKRRTLSETIDVLSAAATHEAPIAAGDPGASAVATYFAALGLPVPQARIGQWLSLVPVIALELGAAMAFLVVQSVSGGQPNGRCQQQTDGVSEDAGTAGGQGRLADAQALDRTASLSPDAPAGRTPNRPARSPRERTPNARAGGQSNRVNQDAVVGLLKAHGGRLQGGQRSIAKALGVSKTRTNEMLREMRDAGAIRMTTSREGTMVALIAN